MRAYDRSKMKAPEILFSEEVQERQARIAEYIASVREKGEQRRPPDWQEFFSSNILAYTLAYNFAERCAYCERHAGKEDGLVHHHRPPALAASRDGKTHLLNYIWLTYDWDNLLWVCKSCARFKENRFYAMRPIRRTDVSIADLRKAEGELFLDPCYHTPHRHLQFLPTGHVAPTSEAGGETIDLFRLNDSPVVFERRDTIGRIAQVLRDPNRLSFQETVRARGQSSEMFIDRSGSTHDLLQFIGGATLAVLGWAKRKGLNAASCGAFLADLEQRQSERDAILNDLDRAIDGDDATEFMADVPPHHYEERAPQSLLAARKYLPSVLQESSVAQAQIQTITIRNYKALKGIELTLPADVGSTRFVPCAVILGENATGKSSVLEAVTMALLGINGLERLDETLKDEDLSPAEMLHRPDPYDWDVITDEPLEVKITYYDQPEVTHLMANSADAGYEGAFYPAKVLLAYGPRRYFSSRKTRRFRAPQYRVRSLFDPVATIPNPIDWLLTCDSQAFNAAVRALREVLMLEDSADVFRDESKSRIMIDTDRGRTPLANLSEGYKSVVAMAADIIRELLIHYDNIENAHAVVLIDEIETHLHPRWKMQIVDRFRKAFPRVQFIVTTHEPLCLRGMFRGEVFVLHRDPKNRRVETLSDLPDVRGMRAEQILTSEFFGLGTTDPETDARLMRYQALTAKQKRTDPEETEWQDLREYLSKTMTVGDTLQEQIFNAAVSQSRLEPFAPMPKVRQASRRVLVDELVTAISDIEKNFHRDSTTKPDVEDGA